MESVYDLYRRGQELLERGDFAAAAVPLSRARDLEPDKASIREALGRALFHSQRYREAAEEFRVLARPRRPTTTRTSASAGRCSSSAATARPAGRSRSPRACGPSAASTAPTATARGAAAAARELTARVRAAGPSDRTGARRTGRHARRRDPARRARRRRPRRWPAAWRIAAPYVRLVIEPYRGDRRQPEACWRRSRAFRRGGARGPLPRCSRRSLARLEVHLDRRAGGAPLAWFAVACPAGSSGRRRRRCGAAYPNSRAARGRGAVGRRALVRLRSAAVRAAAVDWPRTRPGRGRVEPLLRAMAAAGGRRRAARAAPAPAVLGCVGLACASRQRADRILGAAACCGPWFYADVRRRPRTGGRRGRSRRARGRAAAARRRARPRPRRALAGGSPGRATRPDALPARGGSSPRCGACRRSSSRGPVRAPGGPAWRRRRRAIARRGPGRACCATSTARSRSTRRCAARHVAVVGAVEQGKTSFLVASVARGSARARTAR